MKSSALPRKQAYEQFSFLLQAFRYGVPPHAGLAYGLDRLVMLMAGADSIREVIAFPKVKDASCLMTQSPSVVDEKQLSELQIAVTSGGDRRTVKYKGLTADSTLLSGGPINNSGYREMDPLCYNIP